MIRRKSIILRSDGAGHDEPYPGLHGRKPSTNRAELDAALALPGAKVVRTQPLPRTAAGLSETLVLVEYDDGATAGAADGDVESSAIPATAAAAANARPIPGTDHVALSGRPPTAAAASRPYRPEMRVSDAELRAANAAAKPTSRMYEEWKAKQDAAAAAKTHSMAHVPAQIAAGTPLTLAQLERDLEDPALAARVAASARMRQHLADAVWADDPVARVEFAESRLIASYLEIRVAGRSHRKGDENEPISSGPTLRDIEEKIRTDRGFADALAARKDLRHKLAAELRQDNLEARRDFSTTAACVLWIEHLVSDGRRRIQK